MRCDCGDPFLYECGDRATGVCCRGDRCEGTVQEGVMADNQIRAATEGVTDNVLRDVKADQNPPHKHIGITALDADIIFFPRRRPRGPFFQHVLYIPYAHAHIPLR